MNPVLIFATGELLVVLAIVWVITRPNENPNEHSRMVSFGSVILTGAGLIFLLAMAMYYFEPRIEGVDSRGKEIFDRIITVLPPIVTLVLGYYFGKNEKA